MPQLFPPAARSDLRSRSLDLLRFPLAVIVVLIHVVASRTYTSGGMTIHIDRLPGADLFFSFIDAFLRGQSVPIYFFISGYVFFLGIDLTMDTYGRKLRNRTHSLLIPYIGWNILAIATAFIAYIPQWGGAFQPQRMFSIDLSPAAILECFWNSWYGILHRLQDFPAGSGTYPQDYPLWFVRDLMIIVVCAPMVFRLLKTTRWYAVVAMGAAWICLSPVRTGHPGQLLTGFFFFTWGGYMSYHKRDMIRDFRRWLRPALPAFLIVGILHMILAKEFPLLGALLKSINAFLGMIVAYGMASWLIERRGTRVNRFLAAASFFVYCGHALIVAYLNMLLFLWLRPTSIWSAIGIYGITLTATVIVLLALYRVLGMVWPSLQKILGGRNWPPQKKPAVGDPESVNK